MDEVRIEIAKNIKRFREVKNIKQKELATLLGFKTASKVSNWENGHNSIDIDTLHKVCRVLEVDLNDMFGIFSNKVNSNSRGMPSSDEDETISLINQLDELDKAEIKGTVKQMLKADKYQEQGGDLYA